MDDDAVLGRFRLDGQTAMVTGGGSGPGGGFRRARGHAAARLVAAGAPWMSASVAVLGGG